MGGWEEEKEEEELVRSRMNQAAAEWVEIIEPRTKVSRWIENLTHQHPHHFHHKDHLGDQDNQYQRREAS